MKCRYPIQLNVKGRQIYVPCGKCAWCLRRKQMEWFVRLKYEGSKALFKSFLTFTYRDEDLPTKINHETGEVIPTVSKYHIDRFHHDMRKKGYKFRFMVTSEYGPEKGRPHYHGVYFHNEPIDFANQWPYGDNNFQEVAEDGSYLYITKYMLKGSNVPEGADPNFFKTSRRPGIGAGLPYEGDLFILGEDDRKFAVPRYYKKKYFDRFSKQVQNMMSETKLDYLAILPIHDEFHREYESLVADGSLDPELNPFEDWLSAMYRKDFNKQIKINKKHVDF